MDGGRGVSGERLLWYVERTLTAGGWETTGWAVVPVRHRAALSAFWLRREVAWCRAGVLETKKAYVVEAESEAAATHNGVCPGDWARFVEACRWWAERGDDGDEADRVTCAREARQRAADRERAFLEDWGTGD